MLTAETDPLIGRELAGRYRIVKVLGEGGMGKVYLAEQKLGNAIRKVAVKTLRPELSKDPALVGRFHRECETVIQLHHPNTVQFYDFGELREDSLLYIVMEYIEGRNLAERLAEGPLPLALVDKLLIQICGSLHEAHQNGIVHRDLKPDNILLTERGGQTDFVKVLDFGIAKNNQVEDAGRTQLTMQGMILGTPPYMSPEQFGSEPLDARSDVYSLGLITYEMLTARLPFEARTPWEWATRHLTERPIDLAALDVGRTLPPSRRDAIMRALEKDRTKRQASVMEFLREFTGINDTQTAWAVATSGAFEAVASASLRPPPPDDEADEPVVLPEKRLRGPLVVASLVLAAVAFGAVHWVTSTDAAEEHEAITAAPSEPAPGPAPTPESKSPAPAAPAIEESPAEDEVLAEAPEPPSGRRLRPSKQTRRERPSRPEPTKVRPEPPKPEPTEVRPEPPKPSGPSEAAIAEAESLLAGARSEMRSGNLETAAAKLRGARALVGGNHAGVQSVTQELATLGGRSAGNLLMRGRCEEAQALYRTLRGVQAHGPAGTHFASDWCPKP
ncbi:MAG: protein kinase [Myxococcales bacterium]|nr:protein kinase [Myxococcales bacterium]